jgi:hypothetical protein
VAITVSGRPLLERVYTGANELKNKRRVEKDNSKLRSMQQITSPTQGKSPMEYVFFYPPQSFTHEGYGLNLNQIPRPYMVPIVDPLAGNARKASFEFSIMAQLDLFRSTDNVYVDTVGDAFQFSADDEIAIIQAFADNAIPVVFNNVHQQLQEVAWYIESVTFNHNRTIKDGNTTAATCNISLVEFTSTNKKLILLPRFKYGNITQTTKKGVTTNPVIPDAQANADAAIAAVRGIPVGSGSSAQGGTGAGN